MKRVFIIIVAVFVWLHYGAAEGGQRSAVSGQRSAVGVQRTADSVQRSAVSGQRSAVGVQRSAFGGQRSAVSGQPYIGSKPTSTGQRYTDTVAHRPYVLNEVEVLGVKTLPSRLRAAALWSSPALSEQIERGNVVAVKNISALVPNLYIPAYGSRITSSIYMRGLGSRIDRPIVGLSVDGVPIENKDAYDFDIPDIASIEVLRGAQSLLNGSNSMVGQINIHTLSPRDFQGIRLSAQYGRYNRSRFSAGVYQPIASNLYTALSAYFQHSDGAYTNEFNNSDCGGENSASLRWKTVFSPSQALSVTNTASLSLNRQYGYPYENLASGQIAYNDTCFYRRTSFADGLTVAWASKRVVVTSMTSFQYLNDNMTLDQDFTPRDYFTLTQAKRERSVTQDLFAKGSRGNYSWLGGVFAFGQYTDMNAPVTFYDYGISTLIEDNRNRMNPQYPISWDSREFPLNTSFSNSDIGFAIYHESKLDIQRWSFECGFRWNYDQARCRYHSDAVASYTTWHQGDIFSNTPVAIHDNGKLKQIFNEFLPKISLSYRFDHGSAFASFSKGYKSGGYNTQMFSDVLQQRVMQTMGMSMLYSVNQIVAYKPEHTYNYEIGTRYTCLNNRLNAELVLFYIYCRDQQLTDFPDGMVTGRIMTNAGRSRSFGVELSANYTPCDPLSFSLAYGYTNARFRRYNDGKADYAGKRIPYAPEHTLLISAQYKLPFTFCGFVPTFSSALRGVGSIMWNEENTLSQPFYGTLQLGLDFRRDNFTITLRGDNITDTKYNTFYFKSMGNSFVQRAMPLTYSIGVSYNL